MNMNQFTQKTIEAIQRAQQIAVEYGHQQVDQEHVMLALTEDNAALIPQLLVKCGLSADSLRAAVTEALSRIARVSGPGREADKVYISSDLEKSLIEAEARAKQMKDEYLSVEHVWMGLCQKPNARVKDVLRRIGYDEKAFLKALSEVRGATRVTTDSPEDTYDALKKYGSDLVELARLRPGRTGPAEQARSRHRPGQRDPQRHPYPEPQDKEQSGAHRRTRRGQDCYRRGPGPAHRGRGCAL